MLSPIKLDPKSFCSGNGAWIVRKRNQNRFAEEIRSVELHRFLKIGPFNKNGNFQETNAFNTPLPD